MTGKEAYLENASSNAAVDDRWSSRGSVDVKLQVLAASQSRSLSEKLFGYSGCHLKQLSLSCRGRAAFRVAS